MTRRARGYLKTLGDGLTNRPNWSQESVCAILDPQWWNASPRDTYAMHQFSLTLLPLLVHPDMFRFVLRVRTRVNHIARVPSSTPVTNYPSCPIARFQDLQQPTVELRLFPALPKEWPTGRFRGLRTRGGLEVEVAWEDGEITGTKLRLIEGQPGTHEADSNMIPNPEHGPRCLVFSQTRLVLVPDESASRQKTGALRARQMIPRNDSPDVISQGEVFWYVIEVGPLRPGQVAKLVPPIDSQVAQ